MKNKKMKKIIFKAIAIVLVTLIFTVNVRAETDKNPAEYKNDPKIAYCYFIIGKGYIGEMTINDKEENIGKVEGCLHIWNIPGWNSPDYILFIFNKNTNKLLNKKTLPKEFMLQGFVGFGYITYINIPHSIDATKYFIIGKAIDLLE